MTTFAYLYSDPLLEPSPEVTLWGSQVDRVYQDFGDRVQWQQLLQDCQTTPPDYLLVRRLAELGDTVTAVGEAISRLETLGINLIATEQSDPSHAQASEIRANLFKLLHEIETHQRSRRLRQGHARNRLQAKPPPGKAPYGYRRGQERYLIDRSTAPVVKDFFERFLLFGSLRGAVRYLEKKYGKKIAVSTGRRWLTNPAYRGDLEYGDGKVIPNTHQPILSREEAAQIDRLLRRNRRLPPRTASAPRSLAGLVVCQQCQSPQRVVQVTARGRQHVYLYLRPVNCSQRPKCRALPYQTVLERAIERICQDLPPAVAQIELSGLTEIKAGLQAESEQKQAILSQLPQLQADGILDAETVALRRYKLQSELSQLQAQLAQLPPENLPAIAQAVSIPQFWLDLSEAERRFYLREFLQKIELIRTSRQEWQLQLIFCFSRC